MDASARTSAEALGFGLSRPEDRDGMCSSVRGSLFGGQSVLPLTGIELGLLHPVAGGRGRRLELAGRMAASVNPGACVDLGPYRRRRETLLEALRGKGYEVIAPEGTFYLFPKTPGGDDALFVRHAMEDLVLLVPGRAFGWPGCFRIAFGADDRSVEIAAEKIPQAGTW